MEITCEQADMKLAEVLFDNEDMSEIVLKNEQGRRIRFGQVYATVMDEKVLCILSPIDAVDGVAGDAALPFCMGQSGELRVIRDGQLSEKLFREPEKIILSFTM